MIKWLRYPLFTVGIRYGIISGFMCLGLIMTFYYFGKSPMLINPYADFRILLFGLLIFFLLKELREYFLSKVMYFWQGMAASVVFVFATVIISSLGILILVEIYPEFLLQYTTQLGEQLKNLPPETIDQIGNDVYNKSLRAIPNINSGDIIKVYTLQCFVIGFFISIIMSVFLKRSPIFDNSIDKKTK